MDCLDAGGGWAVTMPETDGLALDAVLRAVATIARVAPVVGVGATGVTLTNGDAAATVDAIAALAAAGLAGR